VRWVLCDIDLCPFFLFLVLPDPPCRPAARTHVHAHLHPRPSRRPPPSRRFSLPPPRRARAVRPETGKPWKTPSLSDDFFARRRIRGRPAVEMVIYPPKIDKNKNNPPTAPTSPGPRKPDDGLLNATNPRWGARREDGRETLARRWTYTDGPEQDRYRRRRARGAAYSGRVRDPRGIRRRERRGNFIAPARVDNAPRHRTDVHVSSSIESRSPRPRVRCYSFSNAAFRTRNPLDTHTGGASSKQCYAREHNMRSPVYPARPAGQLPVRRKTADLPR